MSGMTAKQADLHWLYENAVQNPEAEVDFITRIFREYFDKPARFLREDFCGTANLGCRWVEENPENTMLGVDLDQPTLDWGRKHNLSRIPDADRRIELICDDVRNITGPRADVMAATNFSWWGFHTRDELLSYLRNCYESLRDEGLLVLDIYGGPEAQVAQFEERECEGFTYVWDQDLFNPITHEYRCNIHFRFPDGTEMENAFQYHWRLWSIPETVDILKEAGFNIVEVYWEGADDDGDPDGDFQVNNEGDTAPAWVAYIVAVRGDGKVSTDQT